MNDIKINPPRRDGHPEGITVIETIPGIGFVRKNDTLGINEHTSDLSLDDFLEEIAENVNKDRTTKCVSR
jgi:hypothetical protein